MAYLGDENATAPLVRRYLQENCTNPDGTELSPQRLDELLVEHDGIVQTGVRDLSYARYVGDKISEAAGLLIDSDEDEDETA